MFMIRRSEVIEPVLQLLKLQSHINPSHTQRLAPKENFFLLPINSGRIEFYGSAQHLPRYICTRDDVAVVELTTNNLVAYGWDKADNGFPTRWMLTPPDPDHLRELANGMTEGEQDLANNFRKLADWIETIPLAPTCDPNA